MDKPSSITAQTNLTVTKKTIVLPEELHQIYVALEEKALLPSIVKDIFLRKWQSEQNIRQISFWQIAVEYHYIKEEETAKLRNIHGSRNVEMAVNPNRADELLFADYLMKNNLAERHQIQGLLRLAHQLDMLGISTPFHELLVSAKVVAAENINALLSQFQQSKAPIPTKSPEIQITSSKSSIISKKPKNYFPEILLGLVVIVILIFVWIGWAINERKFSEFLAKDNVQTSEPVKPPNKPKIPQPTTLSIPQPTSQNPISPQQMEQEMNARGLSRWGNYWINIEDKKALSQIYQPGIKPLQPPIWQWEATTHWSESFDSNSAKSQGSLQVNGRVEIPNFPGTFILYLDVDVKDTRISVPRFRSIIPISPNKPFQTIWNPSKILPKGEYILKLTIFPESQSEFLRDFLSLTEPVGTEIPFMIGSSEEITQQKTQIYTDWKKICAKLDQEYQKIKGWIQHQQRFSKQQWLQEKQKCEQVLIECRAMIDPNLPCMSETLGLQWKNTYTAFQQLIRDMDQWNQSLDPIYPEFLEQQAEWEIQFAFLLAEIAQEF